MSMANESLAEAQPAPLSILSALTLPAAIAGRYELTEVIEQTGAMIVYRAHDRMRCGQCSTLRADMSDPYCIECGAEIGSGAPCRVQAGDIPPDAPQEHLLTENDATYWILPEPVATPTQALASKGLHLRVGYASDSGMVRDLDEDSLLVVTGLAMVEGITQPSLGLFAVADGMGGHENGQVASRRVIQVLSELLMPRLFAPTLSGETILPETSKGQVRDAIQEANRRLTLEAREADSDMGSTLTLAWVRDGTTLIANVGDSRTYLWHGGALDQVTQDHSMVALQIAEEKIDKNAIYTHPRRNEIYRVMGDKPDIEVDVFQRDLQPGDRLVLCCDGVWEMIHDEGIEEVLLAYPDNPQAACDEMVKQANTAGGEDNISVIVVDMH
jgi:serine/threonine protein phosphatase PrpC